MTLGGKTINQNKNMTTRKAVTMTLSNSFHATEIHVRIPVGFIPNGMQESYQWLLQNRPATAHRVWKKLCGQRDCTCGTVRS
jgi:hypothetical protein